VNKVKAKIRLDTLNDVHTFVNIATQQEGAVHITDDNGLKVSAKSILGALYALEFDELWCESENDIYSAIEEFIIIE
jgi:hypothetical protein